VDFVIKTEGYQKTAAGSKVCCALATSASPMHGCQREFLVRRDGVRDLPHHVTGDKVREIPCWFDG
jgi:hypothetical protein